MVSQKISSTCESYNSIQINLTIQWQQHFTLFTTGIIVSTYCDQQINEIKRNTEKHQYPCGLPPSDNCCSFKENNFDQSPSGIYKMNSWCSGRLSIVDMYCDTTTTNGGWTVIQRRKDGSENFNQSWADYEKGFGDLNGEFWYGLKTMNCLTQTGQWELRVDFEFPNKTRSYLHYNLFRVGSACEEYPLTIDGFTGKTFSDPFITQNYLNGMKFSTYDNDNDSWRTGNCAMKVGSATGNGGWWYNQCWNINLNSQYNPAQYGLISFGGNYYNPNWIEMKIRPFNCATE
ncbi:fibrinogen-like protein A [Dysidea avara]|uniref:fibrinogen-like protein A n=1 Tax=Dysidea avara TaxID=196820 RepID=UPI00331A0CAB